MISHLLLRALAPLALLMLLTASCREGGTGKEETPGANEPSQAKVDWSHWEGLDEKQRAYLWEVEGVAFQVEEKIFPRLHKALASGSFDLVEDLFQKGTELDIPRNPWTKQEGPMHPLILEEVRTGPSEAVPIARFATLFDGLLEQEEPTRLRLLNEEFGPLVHGETEGPWKARTRIIARSKWVEAEVTLEIEMAPLDREVASRTAPWIRSVRTVDWKRRTGTRACFEEATASSRIPAHEFHDNWTTQGRWFHGGTGGAFVEDFDGDGTLDLLFTDAKAGVRLYRGEADLRFSDVSEITGLADLFEGNLPSKAAWADFDRDGDPDLLVGSRLLENIDGKSFAERTFGSGLSLGNASSYSVADFDGDGLLDLFISYSRDQELGTKDGTSPAWIDGGWGVRNQLWRNLGEWRFEDTTEKSGAGGSGGSTFAVACLDANSDGATDLFEINEFGNNHLLLNRGDGTFEDRGDIDPVFGGMSMGVTAGDADNDGRSELFVANMYSKAGTRVVANLSPDWYPAGAFEKLQESTLGNQLYRNLGEGSFEVAASGDLDRRLGWSYGNRFIDIDGDGWLDLYATAGFVSKDRREPDG